MHDDEDKGLVNIYYLDGSGFSTTSPIPYAWQKKGETFEIPCKRGKRLSVLGIINRFNESFFHIVEGSLNSKAVIEAFDIFASRYEIEYKENQIKCVVIMDNASIHHSKAVKLRMADWEKQGVNFHFIPPYSPELNLIEILWKKIKYEWMPLSAYKNYQSMKSAVLLILDGFGKKYTISFR
jgi:transposase